MKRLLLLPVLLALLVPAAAEAKTFMACDYPRLDFLTVAKFKPRACTMLKYQDSHAEGHNYGRLRWTHWGAKTARFRGISKGFHLPFSKIKVFGRLYRPRVDQCRSHKKVFTRMAYGTKYGRSVYGIEPCLGRS